jgi:hypothetical protein
MTDQRGKDAVGPRENTAENLLPKSHRSVIMITTHPWMQRKWLSPPYCIGNKNFLFPIPSRNARFSLDRLKLRMSSSVEKQRNFSQAPRGWLPKGRSGLTRVACLVAMTYIGRGRINPSRESIPNRFEWKCSAPSREVPVAHSNGCSML